MTSEPTSAIAPATCRNSGKFHESGRTTASISVAWLPDHEDGQDRCAKHVDDPQHAHVAAHFLPLPHRAGSLRDLPVAVAGDRPEHERAKDPKPEELVADVPDEPQPERQREDRADRGQDRADERKPGRAAAL